MNYCPRCKENDGIVVEGIELTMKEKIMLLKDEIEIIYEFQHVVF